MIETGPNDDAAAERLVDQFNDVLSHFADAAVFRRFSMRFLWVFTNPPAIYGLSHLLYLLSRSLLLKHPRFQLGCLQNRPFGDQTTVEFTSCFNHSAVVARMKPFPKVLC